MKTIYATISFIVLLGCNQQPEKVKTEEEQSSFLFEQVRKDMENKAYSDAIAHVEELIKLDTSNTKYQQVRIAVLLESREISPNEALELLNKLNLNQDNLHLTETIQNMIVSLGEAGAEAILHYKNRIQNNPDYYDNYYRLANELVRVEKYEEAIKNYSKSLELEPMYKYAHAQRGLAYYKMGDIDRACQEWLTPGGGSITYFDKYCK